MPFTPNRAETNALQRNADRVALGIIRTCRIPRHEQEDLRQDLLTDFFARLKGYDPARGDLGAYATACFQHRAIRLIERIQRGRATMAPVSLDDPQPGREGLTIGDSIAEADGYGAWQGQPTDAFATVERRIDLDRALGSLPTATLSLCAELTEHTPHELAKVSRTSRAGLYRQLRELRLRLQVAGIPAAA
jgi:RNA polymerase sigma factor (sigma-70 family)